jgi:hypothetical protein
LRFSVKDLKSKELTGNCLAKMSSEHTGNFQHWWGSEDTFETKPGWAAKGKFRRGSENFM